MRVRARAPPSPPGWSGARALRRRTDLDGADQTAALLGERSRAVRLDVADAGSVARLMAEVRESHGRLDALFNCAGVDGMVRPLTELSEENFELGRGSISRARS